MTGDRELETGIGSFGLCGLDPVQPATRRDRRSISGFLSPVACRLSPVLFPAVVAGLLITGATPAAAQDKAGDKPSPTAKKAGPTIVKKPEPAPSPTTEPSAFAAANRAYKQGRYEQAIPLYEALVATGVEHEDLFYNLGNAYFRSGRLGPAIYQYERALRIDPGHDDARYNLEIARQVVAERVVDRLKGAENDPWWVRLATFFSISQLTIGFLIFDVLLFSGLIALRFLATGFARSALVATVAFVGLTMAGSLVLLRLQVYVHEEVHQGIVIADQVVMREGADQRSAERGKLHPGVRVRLRGREPGWWRIRLANGMEGWVPDTAVGRL